MFPILFLNFSCGGLKAYFINGDLGGRRKTPQCEKFQGTPSAPKGSPEGSPSKTCKK